MTLADYFNQSIQIRRLVAGTGNRRFYESTGTIDGHIQRTQEGTDSAEYAVWGATHKAWFDVDANIKNGDHITDTEGNEYEVVMVYEQMKGIAMNEHREVLLRLHTS